MLRAYEPARLHFKWIRHTLAFADVVVGVAVVVVEVLAEVLLGVVVVVGDE